MSYSYHIDTKNNCLCLECSKDDLVDGKEAFLNWLVEFLENYPQINILFDIREIAGLMSMEEHMDFAGLLSAHSSFLNRFKKVFLTDEIKDSESLLFPSVAYSEGLGNFVLVDRLQDAELWFSGQIR